VTSVGSVPESVPKCSTVSGGEPRPVSRYSGGHGPVRSGVGPHPSLIVPQGFGKRPAKFPVEEYLYIMCRLKQWICRSAVAQTRTRRLPTAEALVPARTKSCGICRGHTGTGAGFLPVLRFPLPLIHSTNCSTVITVYHPGWYNRPVNGRRYSGLGCTTAPEVNTKS
jgi:hypothetical protein